MTHDPVRLLADPNAPSDVRGDLGRAAEAPGPRYEIDAGLSRLTTAIAALPSGSGNSSPPAGTGSAGGAAAGGAALGAVKSSSVFTSAVFWGFTACGVVGAALVWVSPIGEPPNAPKVVSQPALVVTQAPPRDVEPMPSSPVEKVEAAEAPSAAASAPALASATRAADDLALETADLAELRTTASSDPTRALELATSGQHRFPHGVFGLEREAIAIGALSKLGRADEAKRRGEAFVAAHPTSVYAEAIRRSAGL